MMEEFPTVYLATHGETAWTTAGKYNGMTDLPLTENGENEARALSERLQQLTFAKVFTSPLQRVLRTCELAGFGDIAEIDSDLREWDYGTYEGLTEAEIRSIEPDWQLFRDGCPHGEAPDEVTARADKVIAGLRSSKDDVLVFSSIHFVRAVAVRWIGLSLSTNARRFLLNPASLSAVGYDKSLSRPVIRLWNDAHEFPHLPFQSRVAAP